MHVWRAVLAVTIAAVLGGCGGSRAADEQHRARLEPLPPAGSGGPRDARAVGFRSLDGTGLRGRLFGHGEAAVVLSHMGNLPDSEADWYALARRLARDGYLVLAYNRQGVCSADRRYDCSAGQPDYRTAWKDVVGAVRFVQSQGVRRVAIGGASIGGTSSVYAAQSGLIHPAAVISLAGVNYVSGYTLDRADVERIGGAKLFVSARLDPANAARSARVWAGWARAPKRLVLLDSNRHGTDMLAPAAPTRRRLTELLVRFVETYVPASG